MPTSPMPEEERAHHSAQGARPHIGVLLCNLGSPDAPEPDALRRYLREFLSDPRVVETNRLLWWPILHGIILRTRPARSARAYRRIWRKDGAPLLHYSQRQREALQQVLRERFPRHPLHTALGMRYGRPSIAQGLAQLREQGCGRIFVLPLYPQYSASTTASSFDALANTLRGWRWLPAIRISNGYHDHPLYIEAMKESIERHWRKHGRAERLLMSFHGIPQSYADAGDPYPRLCHESARLLANALGLRDDEWKITFQSRFGREPWVQPYTDETLRAWGRQGLASVDVICPGFAADCLETLEEIAMENRELFHQAGGGEMRYIPALNDAPAHIRLLAGLCEEQLAGWL